MTCRALRNPSVPTLAELEAMYDGAIPQGRLDALRYGSVLDDNITRTKATIDTFTRDAETMRASALRWEGKGFLVQAMQCRENAIFDEAQAKTHQDYLNTLEAKKRTLAAGKADCDAAKDMFGEITQPMDGESL